MKRIRLVVAYDGTQYHGWQIQPGAVTIESVLNEALTQLMREPIQVIGASRTDSGVHARGNVAVFDTESQMPPDKICMALNQRLPEDIRVQVSEEVPSDWHPISVIISWMWTGCRLLQICWKGNMILKASAVSAPR